MAKPYRVEPSGPLSGGIDDARPETQLAKGQTPRAINMDFDRSSAKTARGSIPFNRQVAPTTSVRCRPDKALSPLYVAPGKAVPLHGYVYLPYVAEFDIGGRTDMEGDAVLGTDRYFNRRGRSFGRKISFRLPEEERFYETETRISAPAVGAESAGFGGYSFDEGEDECFLIAHKGGDRAPMSWALGVVNIGRGLGLDVASSMPTRVSNYAFVFMWLDSMGWGITEQPKCKYNLTTGQNPAAGAASQNASQAYRALLIHKFIEPGRTYHIDWQLQMDSGTPGTNATNTAWTQDGFFKVFISEDGAAPTTHSVVMAGGGLSTTRSGIEVYKGPLDSDHYLLKYGIRYQGSDGEFLGGGQRFIPWSGAGFIPLGQDAVALKNGGHQMAELAAADLTAATSIFFYGAGVHTLTAEHVGAETSLRINHRGFSVGNTNGGSMLWSTDPWTGLGAGTATWIQPNALRNYKLVMPLNMAAAGMRGARIPIGIYTEDAPAGPYRVEAAAGGMGAWGPTNVMVQAFRWHQREIEVGDYRMYSTPRAYETGAPALVARRRMSLRMTVELDDTTEPDLDKLVFYYPLNDAGGSVVREKLVGGVRNGHFAPFGLGVTDGGQRGESLVFLSGEGEAPCFDLSQNPIYMREVQNMLAGNSQGFALELSCVFPEAYYAIPQAVDLPDSGVPALAGTRPQFAPDIMSWEVRDPLDSGMAVTPKAILRFTFRAQIPVPISNPQPYFFPMAPSLELSHATDQQDWVEMTPSDVAPWYWNAAAVPTARYGRYAPWVGKHVTLQVGVQSTGTADQYDVYIAMSPKDAFNPQAGDPGDAEFTYWTAGGGSYQAAYAGYFTAAHLTIKAKELARSVITIGRFDCGAALGYMELQPRILVDELRVYGASGSGSLPLTNGGIVATRNGKLEGINCLPPRQLEDDEILRPVGPGFALANVTDGSNRVLPPGAARFFTANARDSVNACRHTYLYVPGDRHDALAEDTLGTEQEEFYHVADVDNSPPLSIGNAGRAMTLSTPFHDATRNGASAYALRLLAYTAFEDDIRDKLLTLGPGKAFEPGVTTVRDVILTDEFWANRAPVTGGCRLRLYWPGGRIALRDLLPKWVRGLSTPRTNPILALLPHDGAIYGAAKGVLFEADDRWRDDGPTATATKSLAFRSRELDAGVTVGLQRDRVQFDVAQNVILKPSATDAYTTIYDAWVNLDACGEYQTVLWVGDPATNPQANAGSGAGLHKIHCILRFTRGRPEIVFGSTAFYTGTTQPEKGLFIATAANPIAHTKDVHVRWYVYTRAGGTIVKIPFCKIQGKPVAVTVNARDNDASITLADDWLRASTIVNPGGGAKSFVGIARDSYRSALSNVPFTQSALGLNVVPQRHTGFLHSLCGRLAHLIVTQQPMWSGSSPPDFNPQSLDYGIPGISVRFQILGRDARGIGHGVHEDSEDQMGTILSHPCISLYHELGDSDEPVSVADIGTAIYATNGGQPARIQQGKAGLAGVLPPTVAPNFRVERFPLWKPNRRTGTTDITQDPVAGAAVGAAQQVNHFDIHQNNYLQQTQASATGETQIAWINVPGTPNTYRWIAFKGLQRVRDTTGRRVWWSRRPNQKAGDFFTECRDGKLVLGWYDIYLKQEVSISTDAPVVQPGQWIYWNVRKRWPQNDVDVNGTTLEGNWENEFWANGAGRRVEALSLMAGTFTVGLAIQWTAGGGAAGTGTVTKSYGLAAPTFEFVVTGGGNPGAASVYTDVAATGITATATQLPTRPMKDKALVRVFDLATPAAGFENNLGAKISPLLSARNCISFTTGSTPRPAGTTATGQVTLPGLRYTGGAGGLVVAPAGTAPFHGDMLGVYWQWGTVGGGAAAFVGQLYKITGFGGAVGNGFAQANVVIAGTATAPNFAGVAVATEGAAFSGVGLLKSANFDQSRMPDNQVYPVYAFGHPDATVAESGIAPYDGEFDSFGWTSIDDTDGQGAQVFEAVDSSLAGGAFIDPALIGTDNFDNDIFGSSAGGPGRCHFDDWVAGPPQIGTFWCRNGRDYAGNVYATLTQPNANVEILGDAGAGAGAGPASSTDAGKPTFKYHQAASTFAAIRYARAAFFDADQNQVSDPGPALLIRPDAEDGLNPSGNVRYVLTDLPSSRQSGNFELWLYLGLAGGSSTTLFRVAFVPDGTREVGVMMPETKIGKFPAISFSNGAPPRCSFVAAAQARLFYGALEVQPDGLVYSNEGFPVAIDYRRLATRFTDGQGNRLTMMRPLDGYLVVAKERAIGGLQVDSSGNARISMISGEGCVAFQSAASLGGRLFYLAPEGWQIVRRVDQTTLGFPKYISERIETFTTERLDRRYLSRVSAAINRRRTQYVFTAREIGSNHTNVRYGIEFDASLIDTPVDLTEVSGFRFSRYEGPNVVCLATVPAPDGGVERLIGGTEEGLILWMDRADSQLQAAGEDIPTWGYPKSHCASNSRTDSISINEPGGVDAKLDGPRGTPIRYIAQDGLERLVTCLGGDGTILHFDEIVDLGCPLNNDVSLGGIVHVYETPWTHLGLPNYVKTIQHLDLECSKERLGEIQVELFVDFDRDDRRAISTLDLTAPKKRCEEFNGMDAIWAKAVISTPPLEVGTKYEVTQLLWAVTDTDRT